MTDTGSAAGPGAGGSAGSQVRVVTDSMAWLPPEMAAEHGIAVVPLHVHFGHEQFTEGVDLTNNEFYRRLRTAQPLPTTSQPSAGEFLEVYRRLAQEGATAILSVHASSKLSGTVRAAATAGGMVREEFPEVRVEALDTLQIAMAQGIIALRASEEAAGGRSFDDILADARALAPKGRILVGLETLEFLQRGGRIGRARAFIGGLLRIRPVITVVDGEVEAKDRARTRAQVVERIVQLMGEYSQGRPFGHVSVLHAEAPEAGEELAQAIQARFTIERFLHTEIGPVIGTHVGPGAFGATFHCD